MHRFYICELHPADNGLNVELVSLTIVSQRVRCQVSDNVLNPVIKPSVHSHVHRNSYGTVSVLVLRICLPVPCLRKRFKIFLVASSVLVYESCYVPSVFSLEDTLATFLAFYIFTQ